MNSQRHSVGPAADAVEIKVIASNAVKGTFGELIPAFEKAAGCRVNITWGGTIDITRWVEGGERADIVIMSAAGIDALVKQGRLAAGSRVDFSRSGIGVAIRPGAPMPDISSGEALKASLLAAKSIVLSSGPSSVYLADLFQKMGIADALKPKILKLGPGLPVGPALANGEGDIGFTQVSEFLGVKGIVFLGPLSADIQHVTMISMGLYTAATAAAKGLVRFLTSPEAFPAIRRGGMEPC
jgi:molybdate transport system substrate-binding protein